MSLGLLLAFVLAGLGETVTSENNTATTTTTTTDFLKVAINANNASITTTTTTAAPTEVTSTTQQGTTTMTTTTYPLKVAIDANNASITTTTTMAAPTEVTSTTQQGTTTTTTTTDSLKVAVNANNASITTTTTMAAPTEVTSTTQQGTTSAKCVGNDSRCKGSTDTKCKELAMEGSDCRWREPEQPGAGNTSVGKCIGNDSRCKGSTKTACQELNDEGSDCRWEERSHTNSPKEHRNVLLQMFSGGANCGELPDLDSRMLVHQVNIPNIEIPRSRNYNPKIYGYQTGNNWVARFRAVLEVCEGGQYVFSLRLGHADTAALFVNGNELVRSKCTWGQALAATTYLESGLHDIQIVYTDDGWEDEVVLSYKGKDTGMVLTAIPSARFVQSKMSGKNCPSLDQPIAECVGNDSRCKGASRTACEYLGAEGADCEWEEYSDAKDSGSCVGNDSRCSGSRHATCNRLEAEGSDCRWKSSLWASGPSGKCVGNDSRCRGSSEHACNTLANEGADCKWRGAFSVSGSMTVAVSDADSFVINSDAKTAVTKGIANFTGVPSAYVDIDLTAELERRRLRAQQPEQPGVATLTYAIAVGGGAPESVATTGPEVGDKLKAKNSGRIADAICSSMEESLGRSCALSIKKVNDPKVLVKDHTSAMPKEESGINSARGSISYSSSAIFIMVGFLRF